MTIIDQAGPDTIVRIALTNGGTALIDATDVALVSDFSWSRLDGSSERSYATTTVAGRLVYMHRLIAGTPAGLDTDHRNRDGLDNRRANLRVATSSQNHANKCKRPGTSSRYKGVSWDPRRRKWQSKITVDTRCRSLGRFDDEFAVLNLSAEQ